MNYYIAKDRFGNYDLAHSIEWKQHKYIRKEGNRYIYPEDIQSGAASASSSSNSSSGSSGNSSNTSSQEGSKESKGEENSQAQAAQAAYKKALIQMQLMERSAREKGLLPNQDSSYIAARAEVLKAKAELDRLGAEALAKTAKKLRSGQIYYHEPTVAEEKKQQDKKARTRRRSALQERLEYERERQRQVDERKKRR